MRAPSALCASRHASRMWAVGLAAEVEVGFNDMTTDVGG